MLRIAIVEDTAFDRKVLSDCLREYGRDTGTEMEILSFSDGQELLDAYPEGLDLLFMDIMMKELDGLSTARLLRRRDEKVLLIFVTSMVQYAVQGYSVDASDFLVKPLSYTGLRLCMDRALKKLGRQGAARLRFQNREGSYSFPASEVCYMESLDHKVYVHTTSQIIPVDSSLAALEKETASLPFFRCHVSYLVNLQHVDRISGNDVWVNGDRLAISRYRRKEFLEAWSAWLG